MITEKGDLFWKEKCTRNMITIESNLTFFSMVTFRRVKKPSINVTPLSGGREKGTESTVIKVIDRARVPLIRDGKRDKIIGVDYRIIALGEINTLNEYLDKISQ